MTWGAWFLAVLIIIVCFLLMLVILLQRGRGGGLVGAFGGAGGSSAFGAKTGDVFTWITVVMATFFVFLAVVSNFVFDQSPAPASPAVAAPASSEPPPGGDESLPITVTPVDGPPGAQGTSPGEGGKTMMPVKVTPTGELVPLDSQKTKPTGEPQDGKPATQDDVPGDTPSTVEEPQEKQPPGEQADTSKEGGTDPAGP